MQQTKIKQIVMAIAAMAAVLMLPSALFAAEKVVTMGQTQSFLGFDRDNVIVMNDLVIWQTAAVSKKPTQKEVIWKLVQGDSGKFYIDIDNFGRAEVRPLKLIINVTRATDTAALEIGSSVGLASGGRWKFLGTVRGKKIQKGDRVIICYDEFDKVHRMIAWDDTWQIAVKKQ